MRRQTDQSDLKVSVYVYPQDISYIQTRTVNTSECSPQHRQAQKQSADNSQVSQPMALNTELPRTMG